MCDGRDEEEIHPGEVAHYIAEMASELARLAREAGLTTVAAGLEQSYRAAMAEAHAFQPEVTKAAADDAT